MNDAWNTTELEMRECIVPWDKKAAKWMEKYRFIVYTLTTRNYDEKLADWHATQTIYCINRSERTIPSALDEKEKEETLLKIYRYYCCHVEPKAVEWNAEGENEKIDSVVRDETTSRQLYQFVDATRYLLDEHLRSPLSVALIIETHRRIMNGSYDNETKSLTVTGRFRSDKVYAGNYAFCDPESVANAVDRLITKYNDELKNENPISKATALFYDLITIHPFINGNGRLCRLLLAWSLMRDGFPFAFDLTSGRKKARKHYVEAIWHARRSDGATRDRLNCLVIESLYRSLLPVDTRR
jgi:fido (protein-threonine AMPylation protein)